MDKIPRGIQAPWIYEPLEFEWQWIQIPTAIDILLFEGPCPLSDHATRRSGNWAKWDLLRMPDAGFQQDVKNWLPAAHHQADADFDLLRRLSGKD